MKRINPAVKVMFGTGKFDHNFKYGSLKGGAVDFIQKPYLPNEVLKRIRDVIGVPQ
jgi:DNA-binding response OmpR family regulator